jgi:hypothetical protein
MNPARVGLFDLGANVVLIQEEKRRLPMLPLPSPVKDD